MSEGATLRIDKWLWFARLAKTRSLAARLCAAGLVLVGGAPVLKPHHPVRVGDSISVTHGRARRRLVVAGLGGRRGPPAEARLLYDETEPPVRVERADPAWTPLLDEEEDWARISFVTPAQAGIQGDRASPALDPRFRGDDDSETS